MSAQPHFDLHLSQERCRRMRRRILDLSQTVPALHIAPAFSCLELLDVIYFGLMRRDASGNFLDTFILSKGHGAMAQYTVLEELGILTHRDLDQSGKPGGRLGMHPDYGLPGIEASTGSLGHGLPLALGMAIADKVSGNDRLIYVVLSDGEMQEGSTWETLMLAPSLGVKNIVAIVDLNDFQSLGQISKSLPNFYPLVDKLLSFGWDSIEINGHDQSALLKAVGGRRADRPQIIAAKTIKGKGVSYMENSPIWHYRSPNPEEYQKAILELDGLQNG